MSRNPLSLSLASFSSKSLMETNGIVSLKKKTDNVDDFDLSPAVAAADSDEVHVLAVDDSLVDRKVIERLLKISACKVTAVDSGIRALQFLGLDEQKSHSDGFGLKVDLIITDYCMPEMTGYELLKKIKESSTLREIPVVIMSSENVLARINRCLEEGAEDFIVKPVKLSDVKRLKNYYMTTRELKAGSQENRESGVAGINKRKSPETSDDPSPSPPSISSLTPSSSPSASPSSSPSPSPSLLDSPIRRLKMANTD